MDKNRSDRFFSGDITRNIPYITWIIIIGRWHTMNSLLGYLNSLAVIIMLLICCVKNAIRSTLPSSFCHKCCYCLLRSLGMEAIYRSMDGSNRSIVLFLLSYPNIFEQRKILVQRQALGRSRYHQETHMCKVLFYHKHLGNRSLILNTI